MYKTHKIRKQTASFAVAAILICLAACPTSMVLAESGPIFVEAWVPMKDGVLLYTRVYLPNPSIWGLGPYPVLLTRTPYGIGTPGTAPTTWPEPVYLGYACVYQDMRGRYYSQGLDRLFYDDISDGRDTLNWIGNQTWCNGNIGIYGYSAPGIAAFLAAAEPHPCLKAIAPLSSSGNLQNDLTFDGGAFRGDALVWGVYQTGLGLSTVPGGHRDLLGLTPGEFATHQTSVRILAGHLITFIQWHNPTLPGWPRTYRKATESMWWMRLPLYNFHTSYVTLQPYSNEILSHPNEDEWRNHFKVYDKVNVPTLLATGWYDFFVKCQIDAFVALQSRSVPVKLVVGPGTHGSPPPIPLIEWFDYWLKGIDNGIMDEPPIRYYCLVAGEWRWTDQWPPKEVEYIGYYLHEGGVLSTDPPTENEKPRSFIYDPKNPVLTMGGTNLFLASGSFDQTPVVTGRNDILSYTSPPLTEDVEITGPLTVYLRASSNCTDTDFTAKLIDVHPTGELMLVADSIIRARFRNSMANPELMTPGTIYTFTIDVGDISHVFKAGHRIRVDISSSNFPKHDRNLNTGGELYKETTMFVSNNTIYHDINNPSYIMLPVVKNWVVIEQMPASKNYIAGRVVPIKFSLRVAATINPDQPFVYNEQLTIKIYSKVDPNNILQTSTFGVTAKDYRIDVENEIYITNFKTLPSPTTYVVEIYRKEAAGMLIGKFEFSTVKTQPRFQYYVSILYL